MSNIAKVKFLFAGNIWEQLIFIPFCHIIDLELSTIIANSIFYFSCNKNTEIFLEVHILS